MSENKIYIANYTPEEFKNILKDNFGRSEGFSDFRYKQILKWYYKKLVNEVEKMTDLTKSFRNSIKNRIGEQSKIVEIYKSKDGTEKFLLSLSDKALVESVLIRGEKRNTLCISTQIGCPVRCIFCASGLDGFKKNLNANEIVEQVVIVRRYLNKITNLQNIVFMGMGEPLLNYDNVVKALQIIESKDCIGIGKNKITLSTAGIVHAIERLMKESVAPNLAISLHSAIEEKRKKLVPFVAESSPKKLLDVALGYRRKTNREVTFEYVLLKDVNTTDEDLKALKKLLKGSPIKVNLIPINYNSRINFKPPPNNLIERFRQELLKEKIFASVRKRCGDDISAACGQLAIRK